MSTGWPDGRRSVPPSDGNPAPGVPVGPPAPRESKRGAKAIVAALVLVLLIVFVIRNSQRVSVDFIVTQGHFRLIWVIVICSILGGVVGYLLGRPPKRARHQRRSGSGSGDVPSA
jgi:uncharacterized integral membrane protein